MRHFIRFVSSPIHRLLAVLAVVALCSSSVQAQQTLGGITGEVSDSSGGVIPGATVTVVDEQTSLTRTVKTNASGEYTLVNLPIGAYTLTYTSEGYEVQKTQHITVQANRTATVNATLKVGKTSETVEVEASPLMNAVDTTNGYVMDTAQIESVPLATGSFTGLATQSAGVSAELGGGTGANSGLGNAPIWANGQRDTSNSFLLNGVDASNLFNGKSTSQVASARVINSTGVQTSPGGGGGVIPSAASIYLSIGNAIPTPAPETITEVRVNASMYDAQQGSTSGAHIDLSTASGTNAFHGTAYVHRGTNWINAAPFFFNQDPDVPANDKVPQLHRYVAGGTAGGTLIKDKLFYFLGYQHVHVSDAELGDSFLDVPVGLSDDRSAGALAAVSNASFGSNIGNPNITSANVDPLALILFNSPSLPGEPGKWLIPNDSLYPNTPTAAHLDNAFIPGTGRFTADLAVANLDYNATSKDTLAMKYFFQHDPTVAPYSYSSVPGFAEHLDSGAQVASIINTLILKSNLSTTETLGILREKNWGDNEQPFGPSSIPGGAAGTGSINMFGSNYFPGVSIYDVLGINQPVGLEGQAVLNIGPNAEGQASNTGVFQNRLAPSGDAIWTLGKHTLSFGGSYTYTQLNTIDKRTGKGTIATEDLSQMIQGQVIPGSSASGFYVTSFLQGNASRYYRANQLGTYVQDKWQITPTLSLTGGVRYDWDGGMTEKYGRIFNFDPSLYSYSSGSDTIANPGLIIAGNNANGTSGVSNTTLTGRQWGIGPRVGAAWQPGINHNTVVIRTGAGIYYDRGELFSYFSPGYAIGTVTGGPFGVNQQLPFVNVTTCPTTTEYFYEGYLATCGGTAAEGNLENPYGTTPLAPPTSPKASDLSNYLPNAYSILNTGSGLPGVINNGQPISLGVYDRANKLPYTINYTLDFQWQPRPDLAFDLGYVGNVGRHQVIPVPFNQPTIASPSSPTLAGTAYAQTCSYGYILSGENLTGCGANTATGPGYLANYEGGNVDLRVPYIGYAAESISYRAAGVDAYNALQAHLEKRMSHGIQMGVSYTWSHALDEQSGLGLFYNGNNPLNLRSSYGSSDFDRTHVVSVNYGYQIPDAANKNSVVGKVIDGWSLVGLAVIQSGQPYSIIDFSGAVGSIFYSTADGITNPVVPLANGCTAKTAKTGASGAWVPAGGKAALNPQCFTLPLLPPGGLGGAIPSNDPYETGFSTGQRNIFRQAAQKRADASLVKELPINERYKLKYTFDVYNLTNTTSFDVPGNEVAQNQYYSAYPNTSLTPLPTGCTAAGTQTNTSFYNCPSSLGIVPHTIGAPRQIQMSLRLDF
ncbi:MAG: TonB-dependent receptor domain-containing protein [Terracidiphilus sp.]